MQFDPNKPKSVSTSTQPHKFFERFLDNNLTVLSAELQDRYAKIEQAKLIGVSPVGENENWKQSNSVSTMKWRQYNVFQFHSTGIYNLYSAIRSMVVEACDYYGLDFDKEQFMVQGWFNITHSGKGKLDWHDHGPNGAPNFHGYYSVSAEPSAASASGSAIASVSSEVAEGQRMESAADKGSTVNAGTTNNSSGSTGKPSKQTASAYDDSFAQRLATS
jgi:hypothetical protein